MITIKRARRGWCNSCGDDTAVKELCISMVYAQNRSGVCSRLCPRCMARLKTLVDRATSHNKSSAPLIKRIGKAGRGARR